MRVLILANMDIGLYKFRKELINELLLNGHEVYISLPDGDLIRPLEKMGCRFIDTPVDRRGINPVTDFKLLMKYKYLMKHLAPDMVITYTIKPNIYGGIAARQAKVPYAVNITGLGTAFERKGILRKIVNYLYKYSLGKAKVVFFENEGDKEVMLSSKTVAKEKIVVLSGAGVNLDDYPYIEYPSNDIPHFLFIGRVMREKGVDELFEAMRRLRAEGVECFLDVVGPFEEDYKDKLEQYEKDGWLKYHGYQNDVRPFIAPCDCFVLPSWHEGMANTNLECAASGRPVITSNIPGCKEAVIEGVSGLLCEPKNSKSLYLVMKQMAEMSAEERVQMSKTGRKHMEDVFDKKKVVAKTIKHLF